MALRFVKIAIRKHQIMATTLRPSHPITITSKADEKEGPMGRKKGVGIVMRCGQCGRIKRWGIWVRLTEKQVVKFCYGVARGEIQVLWTECDRC